MGIYLNEVMILFGAFYKLFSLNVRPTRFEKKWLNKVIIFSGNVVELRLQLPLFLRGKLDLMPNYWSWKRKSKLQRKRKNFQVGDVDLIEAASLWPQISFDFPVVCSTE